MLTEIKEFLFDPLWYHGGNGVTSDHALGKFFIYSRENSLPNANKWDYYKNPCNNYDTISGDTFQCKGHSRKKPWNTITPNQLIGLNENNCDFDTTKSNFYYQNLEANQGQTYKFVTLQDTKLTKNTIIDEYISPRDLQFSKENNADYLTGIEKYIFSWRWYKDNRCLTLEESNRKDSNKEYNEIQKYDPSMFYSQDSDWCNIMYESKFGWVQIERPKDKKFFKFLILI